MKIYTITNSSYFNSTYFEDMLFSEVKATQTREDAQKIFDNILREMIEEHEDDTEKAEIKEFIGKSEMTWEDYDTHYLIKIDEIEVLSNV